MTTYQIACVVNTSDPSVALALEVWLDDRRLWTTRHVAGPESLTFDIEEDDDQHELRFVLSNKLPEHTKINESGEILSDALITVEDLLFDEIKLGQIVINKATYTHDFNGSQAETVNKFYGAMGCNGVVSLKFTTPIYVWLLENM
jgi:hypothetical protein